MDLSSYEDLLDRALSQVPFKVSKSSRYEVPRVKTSIIGSKTVIHNFKQIYETLNRDMGHVLHFMLRELATAGAVEEARLTLQGKFPDNVLNQLIERYMARYVICPVCKKPDTFMRKEGRFLFMVCGACGARASLM